MVNAFKVCVFCSLTMLACAFPLIGCVANDIPGNSGSAVTDVEIGKRGPVTGVGVGGADIARMTNIMAKDILSNPRIISAGAKSVPRVVIDSKYFINEGSQPINRNLITQRLLVELNRAAQGRLLFVGRRHAAMVEGEREIKRAGVVDQGSQSFASRPLGADFRLAGTFGTLDAASSSGAIQRYSQIVFELVDLQTSEVSWTNIYEIERAAVQDIVYR